MQLVIFLLAHLVYLFFWVIFSAQISEVAWGRNAGCLLEGDYPQHRPGRESDCLDSAEYGRGYPKEPVPLPGQHWRSGADHRRENPSGRLCETWQTFGFLDDSGRM